MKLSRLARLVPAMLGAAVISVFSLDGASAQTSDPVVTLRSFDGFTQLRGRMVEFDGSTFTIETVLGTIQVDALQVNCEGEACPQNLLFGAEFGIYGSNTIGADLMPALIEGYADTLDATMVAEIGAQPLERMMRIIHQNGREMAAIDLRANGSSESFVGMAEGKASVGMSARRARDRDMARLSAVGVPDLRDTGDEHVVALDGLIAIVHKSNPIASVSIEELALIFSGALTNWSQLGGASEDINLYLRESESGTFQSFASLVFNPFGVDADPDAERFASNIRLSDSVANDPNGIGITAVAYERAAKALPIRQECGINSVPTVFSMKTEEYPLARRLYLYTPPKGIPAHARQIVQFAKSDAAQPLIVEAGFVNQAVETQSINEMGSRIIHAMIGEDEFSNELMQELLVDLRDADRLSTTLRFSPGTSSLTPKSQADAERLAIDLADGKYSGREVLLVGFTDSVGQFALNRALSGRRAQVAESVIRGSVPDGALEAVQITLKGFGELMPVGCNTSLQGRSANRRVEVWLRQPR
ncbi:MAG: phosphate ABC transporter substrate-binding/OmpA family protein [Pseudomonadota bacterium]